KNSWIFNHPLGSVSRLNRGGRPPEARILGRRTRFLLSACRTRSSPKKKRDGGSQRALPAKPHQPSQGELLGVPKSGGFFLRNLRFPLGALYKLLKDRRLWSKSGVFGGWRGASIIGVGSRICASEVRSQENTRGVVFALERSRNRVIII